MKKVHVGKGLDLDALALATSVTALLGIRGSGKSTTAGVIAEGLMDAGIPVIVIDQVGPWFGLRLQPDGKTPSRFKIPVLGGTHGDITLSPQAGRQVAEALAASGSSAVLDISMMRKGERIRFCADFAEAFIDAKKRKPSAVSLILEEAQDVIPQMVQHASPDMARCLGSFDDIASVGRNFGIGLILLSLRPQKLNKGVLNLSENVFGFRMLGPQERKTIADWVQQKGIAGRTEVAGELPSLKMGTAIVWSPSVFNVYGMHTLAAKTTYDASSTPGASRAAVTTKPLDLAALESSMAQVVADAKANDPKALKARIAELERATKAPPAGMVKNPAKAEVRIEYRCPKEIRRLFDVELAKAGPRFAAIRKQVDEELAKLMALVIDVRAHGLGIIGAFPEVGVALGIRDSAPRTVTLPPSVADHVNGLNPSVRTVAGQREMHADAVSATQLSRAGRAILGVLASRGVASDPTISALSGYRKTSSTFANALSELRVAGLLDGDNGRRRITDAGKERATSMGLGSEPPPRGHALLEYWVPKLNRCEGVMLARIYGARTISREALSAVTGYSATSSTFANGLSGLRTLDLIHGPSGGDVTIADVFTE
jgi:predicted kinase